MAGTQTRGLMSTRTQQAERAQNKQIGAHRDGAPSTADATGEPPTLFATLADRHVHERPIARCAETSAHMPPPLTGYDLFPREAPCLDVRDRDFQPGNCQGTRRADAAADECPARFFLSRIHASPSNIRPTAVRILRITPAKTFQQGTDDRVQ